MVWNRSAKKIVNIMGRGVCGVVHFKRFYFLVSSENGAMENTRFPGLLRNSGLYLEALLELK